jgi:hypothetical protein
MDNSNLSDKDNAILAEMLSIIELGDIEQAKVTFADAAYNNLSALGKRLTFPFPWAKRVEDSWTAKFGKETIPVLLLSWDSLVPYSIWISGIVYNIKREVYYKGTKDWLTWTTNIAKREDKPSFEGDPYAPFLVLDFLFYEGLITYQEYTHIVLAAIKNYYNFIKKREYARVDEHAGNYRGKIEGNQYCDADIELFGYLLTLLFQEQQPVVQTQEEFQPFVKWNVQALTQTLLLIGKLLNEEDSVSSNQYTNLVLNGLLDGCIWLMRRHINTYPISSNSVTFAYANVVDQAAKLLETWCQISETSETTSSIGFICTGDLLKAFPS